MLPLLLVLHLLFFPLPSSSDGNSLPGCPTLCGNVSIPFPFGIKPGCHLPGFRLTCNNFSTSTPNLLLPTSSSNMEVSSISLSAASALVLAPIARNCIPSGHANISIDVSNLPFSLSSARNRFTAVGCDSMAVYGTANSYISGCLSFCSSLERIAYSSCSGFGCCQSAIPGGLQRIDASLNSLKSSTSNSTECSYAFIVDKDQFHFAPSNISDFSATTMPVVLDWAVENGTCAPGNNSCGRNAFCSVSSTSKGYLCSCNSGFSGNPYLPNGCKDINECTDPRVNPCSGICHNTQGGYVCSCPRGYLGDGTKSGSGCTKETKRFGVFLPSCSWGDPTSTGFKRSEGYRD
ncbi:hypothetical protein HPP92_012594 [Vanilla planifolia]|uniref:EGF-like domain-containing protein n=1 Tax=Vanilla planifolia TaxID=51239 RepID=A0A835V3H0_VANPL|nr:hypothetical protein HPP92_012594 [Vanilla planifolia]